VYNLVLEGAEEHVPLVNGVGCVALRHGLTSPNSSPSPSPSPNRTRTRTLTRCVSLGHGLTGAVVGHDYYGSAAVLRDLSEQPGWRQGEVTLAAPLLAPTPAAREAPVAEVRAGVVGAAA